MDRLKKIEEICTKFALYTSFYNAEQYVYSLYENIKKLDYDNWKWFVCDDFSSDSTLEKLKEISSMDEKIVLVTQSKKKEMYWQPNNFISLDYEYIMLVCSDDFVDREILNVYDNHIRKFNNKLSILSVDFTKFEESTGNVHSMGYVINNTDFIQKLKTFHPKIDYLTNLNYYAFGHAMCFKNSLDLEFEIDDFDAGAEDSYRMMFMLSKGQWLHIPRNMYKWAYREDSESHSKVEHNFNGNFNVAYNKCLNNNAEPICYYNDSYKELNSLISVSDLHKYNKISILSPNINVEQQEKIKNLYSDKKIIFNEFEGCELYLVIFNYYTNKNSLDFILTSIKDKNKVFDLLIYNLDESYYLTDDDAQSNFEVTKNKLLPSVMEIFGGYNYFSYFRHFIVKLSQ